MINPITACRSVLGTTKTQGTGGRAVSHWPGFCAFGAFYMQFAVDTVAMAHVPPPSNLVYLAPVPIRPTQIPHSVPFARIRTSVATDRQLRASAVPAAQRAIHVNFSSINLTRNRMDGPRIESRWGGGEIFRNPSRPALGSTQPPIQRLPGLSQAQNGRDLALITHPHQTPRLKEE